MGTRKRKKKNPSYKLKRNQIVLVGLCVLTVGILLGLITPVLLRPAIPSNLVWAADGSVSVPRDLRTYLSNQNDCKEYRGNGSPNGIGLWAVYQVEASKFAKIAYGCSSSLSSYIMAVKTEQGWQLLPPSEYFADAPGDNSKLFLPKCQFISDYKISKNIEPFCIESDGSAKNVQNE